MDHDDSPTEQGDSSETTAPETAPSSGEDAAAGPGGQSALPRREFLGVAGSAVTAATLGTGVSGASHDVDGLIGEMTLAEKTTPTVGLNDGTTGIGHVEGIERLDIPDVHITDGPLGVIGATGTATSFPANLAVASTFDRELAAREGEAMALEAKDLDADQLFAPAMNIGRFPGCGRLFDYYSADPHVSGEIGAQVASGIQRQGIVATAKHFVANNQDKSRQNRNEIVGERALREIYLPGFETALVDGGAGSVMAAYNRLNGTFCSEHEWVLEEVLKGEWNWDGFVCSDYCAVHSTVDAANNGLDVSTGCAGRFFGDSLQRAVEDGDVAESKVDEKVRRLLRQFERTGHLDGEKIGDPPARNTDAHQTLSRRLAEEGSVLLKNQNILPLDEGSIDELAIVGHQYDEALVSDSLSSDVSPPYEVAPSDAISSRLGDATVTLGDAEAARDADVAVVYAGEEVSEGVDRGSLALPDGQDDLIAEVASANPDTVVVLRTPGPVEMPWLDDVAAVLEMWYPGMEDGNAAANVLFGDAEPGGKLPITFGRELEDYPAHDNPEYPGEMVDGVTTAEYTEGVFVDYRWFDEHDVDPLFPFGHGESYTSFEYSNFQAPESATFDDGVDVSVDVTNTGDRAGSEVVQLYVEDVAASLPRPPRELRAFERVELAAGETATVTLTLDRDDFTYWDPSDESWTAENGEFRLHVGASSRDVRQSQSVELSGGVDRSDGAPIRPADLNLTRLDDERVELSWDGAESTGLSGVDRYVVYRDGDRDHHVDAETTTTTVDGLLPSHTYEFTVSAVDARGNESETSNTVSVTTDPIRLPGRIQSELYDGGGQGEAYYDTTAGKEGPATFRGNEDVDIETTGPGEISDYAVGWTAADEWLEYTVDVASDGAHDLYARVTSGGGGGAFRVEVDGEDLTGTVDVSDTGGWSDWTTIEAGSIDLAAGEHVVRLVVETGGFNLDWLAVRRAGRDLQGPYEEAQSLPGRIQLQDYDVGGEGIAYHDATDANEGGAYRPDEAVDLHETSDESGAYHVGNTQDDEWLEYTVDVTAEATYELAARVASAWGGAFRVEVDGEDRTGTVAFDATGGWESWETVDVDEVDLSPGAHRVRFYVETGGFDVNWVGFQTAGNYQEPYDGATTIVDRGRLQAEDFDVGGQNAAYYDRSGQNQGGAYRPDELVDIHEAGGEDGGYYVGNTQDDEWLEYTVEVVPDVAFDVRASVASEWGGAFRVEVDGEDHTGTVDFDATGGWESWETVEAGTVDLAPGEPVVRFYVETGGFNLDRIEFELDDSQLPPQKPYDGAQAIPGRVQAHLYDAGGQYVGYYDTSEQNQGGDFRTDEFVDVARNGGPGEYHVGYTADDEWLEYTVDVESSSTYDLSARVASQWGGAFRVEVDGEDRTGTVAFGATGGWTDWTGVDAGSIDLSAGEHVVRLVVETGGFNVDWLEFGAACAPRDQNARE